MSDVACGLRRALEGFVQLGCDEGERGLMMSLRNHQWVGNRDQGDHVG
jgi:hypothetical protein